MTRRWANWLIPCAALPALGPLLLIFHFSVNIPSPDQFNAGIGELFLKAHQGQLSFSDFFAQQDGHRMVVPRLAVFILGSMTHWNVIAEMILQWLTAVAISLAILLLSARTAGGADGVAGRWFMCNLLLFSPASWETWLNGMGLHSFLPGGCLIGALLLLSPSAPTWRTLAGILFLCTIASFSRASGLLTWPLVALPLFWIDVKSRRPIWIASLVGFVVCVALYSIHFAFPTAPAGMATPGMFARLEYAARLLGAPLSNGTSLDTIHVAAMVGVILVILLLFSIGYFVQIGIRANDRELCRRMIVWESLAAFSVLSALMAAIFQVHRGPEEAVASKYCAAAICLPIALINLAEIVFVDLHNRFAQNNKTARVRTFSGQTLAALAAALIFFQAIGISDAVDQSRRNRTDKLKWKSGVELSQILPGNPVLQILPDDSRPRMIDQIRALSQLGFIHPPIILSGDVSHFLGERLPREGSGMIEEVKPSSPGRLVISGWTMLPDRSEPADAVILTYENDLGEPIIFGMCLTGVERPDVAQNTGSAAALQSGWATIISLADLPSGVPLVKLEAWAVNAEIPAALKLQGGRSIVRKE